MLPGLFFCADYDLDTFCLNSVREWFSVTDNFLAVARKFPRPRLVARPTGLASLRPTKTRAHAT